MSVIVIFSVVYFLLTLMVSFNLEIQMLYSNLILENILLFKKDVNRVPIAKGSRPNVRSKEYF
jgi:hypothetical protein